MKKLLISILTILGIGISFCSAAMYDSSNIYDPSVSHGISANSSYTNSLDYNCFRVSTSACRSANLISVKNSGDLEELFLPAISTANSLVCGISSGTIIKNYYTSVCQINFYNLDLGSSCPEPEPSTINVLYNNEQSIDTITCNGDNTIIIDGLSTITATNKFTPYFNIDYKDEDNQSLIESYSNDILYLSGTLFKKTFTDTGERILTSQGKQNIVNTGYIPVFDITGSTAIIDTGNMFNNFSDNALKVLLSNIPAYIQYITIFFILLFLFGFIRRFKSKR